MKKLLMALVILGLATPLVHAQQAAATDVKGKVEAVSVADAAKGTKAEIVVADEAGKKMNIAVTATTTIYDSEAKAITLDKLAKDAKVSVKCKANADGGQEALSINVAK